MLLAAFLRALQPGSECRQLWPLRGPLFSLFLQQLAGAACCWGPAVNSPLAVPASRTASAEGSAAQNPGNRGGFTHLGAQNPANRGVSPPRSCSLPWLCLWGQPPQHVMLGKCSDSLGSVKKAWLGFKDWRNSLQVGGTVSNLGKIKLEVAGIAV